MLFKKSKRRSSQESQKVSRKSLTRVVVAISATLLAWYGMTQFESYILTDKAVATVVVAKKDIPKGVLISAENVFQYFEIRDVNERLKTNTSITSADQLYGKTLTNISAGEIMSSNRIFNTAWVNEEFENPVETSFTVRSADAAVNGTLRSGDLVDVLMLTTDENGNSISKLLLPHTYILKAYNSSYSEISSSDTSSIAVGFTIYVESKDVEKINGQLVTNNIYLVKLDASGSNADIANEEGTPIEDVLDHVPDFSQDAAPTEVPTEIVEVNSEELIEEVTEIVESEVNVSDIVDVSDIVETEATGAEETVVSESEDIVNPDVSIEE